MKNETLTTFTSIEEIRVLLPNSSREEWLTEIICTSKSGIRVKLVLTAVDSYANIWALTHDFEEMELVDFSVGITEYEFGRFQLRIRNAGHVDDQWFMDATVTEL